jgi:nucleoside-diphosphate-sugar epimerase
MPVIRYTRASMSRIVITGAAGFIGSHLCERMLSRGDAVFGLDNFVPTYDPAEKRNNLLTAQSHPKNS